MGFKMRINFVDVIVDDSLKSIYCDENKIGYTFDVRLSYYRGAYLSTIDEFKLKVDGKEIENERITFGINGKQIAINQISDCVSEFWQLIEPAKIEVLVDGGLTEGEHDIDLTLILRIPYLPIPVGDGKLYMPLDSCGSKRLALR